LIRTGRFFHQKLDELDWIFFRSGTLNPAPFAIISSKTWSDFTTPEEMKFYDAAINYRNRRTNYEELSVQYKNLKKNFNQTTAVDIEADTETDKDSRLGFVRPATRKIEPISFEKKEWDTARTSIGKELKEEKKPLPPIVNYISRVTFDDFLP
jgi:hypothetical protein